MNKVLVKNRPSPFNEADYIAAYKKYNPSAETEDNLDIACVVDFNGNYGHCLMNASDNRSKDDSYHWGYNFVSDSYLRMYYM